MGYHDDNGIYRDLSETYGITLAKLKTIDVQGHQHYERVQIGGLMYYFHESCVLAGDDLFVIAPGDNQPGRYLLAPGYPFDLPIAITYALADAALIATAPANMLALLGRSYWEPTVDWTGGTSSAIGISTDTAPHNTQGDLLGGSGGDVAATLVASAGNTLGTIGVDVAGGILFKGGEKIRYDEIVSAFTAGAANVHLVGTMIANPGA